jgi:hypothetical protein
VWVYTQKHRESEKPVLFQFLYSRLCFIIFSLLYVHWSLVAWIVISLVALNLSLLRFSVLGFALPYVANVSVLVVCNGFYLVTPLKKNQTKKPHSFSQQANYTTERPPLVGEISANFCGKRVSHGQRNRFPRPYSRFSRPEPLLFHSNSSSVILRRLSGPRSRPTTSQNIW